MNKPTAILIIILFLIIVPITFYVVVGFEFEISVTQFWGAVTLDTTEIKTLITVNNPTIISRWLKKIEFDLYINGLKIASELSEGDVEIKPWGKTQILLTSFLNNSRIPELWFTYLEKDEFNVTLVGSVTFTSIIREIVCPIGYETVAHIPLMELLSIKQPKDIQAELTLMTLKALKFSWGKATLAQTEIHVWASIYNPNSYPITFKKINYTIKMNDIKMGEEVIYVQIVLEAKTDKNFMFTAILNNAMLNDWWNALLQNNQVAQVTINLQGTVQIAEENYDFIMAEIKAEVSIDILNGTISYGYYVPMI